MIEPSQYMYKYLEINAIIAKQTMAQWRRLKLNRFLAKIWDSRHKTYITAIFTHVVLEPCKNKNYDIDLSLRRHWKQG